MEAAIAEKHLEQHGGWQSNPTRMPYGKPAVLKEFNDAVAKKVSAQTTKDAETYRVEENSSCKGPCHFGHNSSSQRANGREAWLRNPPVSWWPGYVSGGVVLCNQCYQVGYRAWKIFKKAPMPEYVHEAKRPSTSVAFELAAGDGKTKEENAVDHLFEDSEAESEDAVKGEASS